MAHLANGHSGNRVYHSPSPLALSAETPLRFTQSCTMTSLLALSFAAASLQAGQHTTVFQRPRPAPPALHLHAAMAWYHRATAHVPLTNAGLPASALCEIVDWLDVRRVSKLHDLLREQVVCHVVALYLQPQGTCMFSCNMAGRKGMPTNHSLFIFLPETCW
jgi:hypothetical protein